MKTLEQIEELKKKFADAGVHENDEVFNQWDRDYKEAFVRADLKNHEAIKMLVGRLQSDIEGMNTVLLESETLTKEERDRIMDRKKLYLWFLGFFETAEAQMKQIETTVANNSNE